MRHELHNNLLQLMYGNLNYKTTCFGLWRPSSGLDPGTLKQEKSWVASGVESGGSLEDRDLVLPRHCESAYIKYSG